MPIAAEEVLLVAGEDFYTALPLLVTIIPLLAGLALYFFKASWETPRKVVALLTCLFSLTGVILLLPDLFRGVACFDLLNFMQMGLFFRVDLISFVFAFLITFIWTLATVFSFAYMDLEHNRPRFYSVLIFTLGATLGVVLAGDFFTLFLFFELMTLSSFVLVIHEQDREAMRAGMLYLYLGIAGGLSLLFGILLLFGSTGTVAMTPLLEDLGASRTLIFACFLLGFGVKAGLVPLHIWLPMAHPVAPSPASALLSGIMIKTGAYGILRVSLIVFSSPGEPIRVDAAYLFNLGGVLMWIGIITMLLGAIMALLQGNIKRVLAYSSVSQIGYIATAIGVALMMGTEGGMGFAGAIYHVINHAFFKAGLFMMIGTIYIYTHELEMSSLGGMFRKMPLVGVAFLVAAFGIAGIPGFNGYPSKTLVHDSLLIAIKFYDLFHIALAEKIFTLTSALTICYFTKLFRGVFLGPIPEKLDRLYPLPFSIKFVLSSFALIIIAIGIFPNLILEKVLVPAAEVMRYAGYGMGHLYHFHFFEWHPLEAMLIVISLAVLIYIPGSIRGWFDWKPPNWLSIQALIYMPASAYLMRYSCQAGVSIDRFVDGSYDRSGKAARTFCDYLGLMDQGVDGLYDASSRAARKLADQSSEVDSKIDHFYEQSGRVARRLADRTGDMDSKLDRFYEDSGKVARKLADRTRDMDQKLDQFYADSGKAARKLADHSGEVDSALNEAFLKTGQAASKLTRAAADREGASVDSADTAAVETKAEALGDGQGERKLLQEKKGQKKFFDRVKYSTKNLNFDTLLLALVLGAVLFVVFYFGRTL